jgi:hypothetical protein
VYVVAVVASGPTVLVGGALATMRVMKEIGRRELGLAIMAVGIAFTFWCIYKSPGVIWSIVRLCAIRAGAITETEARYFPLDIARGYVQAWPKELQVPNGRTEDDLTSTTSE